MLQAYEGYLEKGRFYPSGAPMSIQGRRRVIVTVLDEPASEGLGTMDDFDKNAETEGAEEVFSRADWLKRLGVAIDSAMDEEFPDIQRPKILHHPLDLSD